MDDQLLENKNSLFNDLKKKSIGFSIKQQENFHVLNNMILNKKKQCLFSIKILSKY